MNKYITVFMIAMMLANIMAFRMRTASNHHQIDLSEEAIGPFEPFNNESYGFNSIDSFDPWTNGTHGFNSTDSFDPWTNGTYGFNSSDPHGSYDQYNSYDPSTNGDSGFTMTF